MARLLLVRGAGHVKQKERRYEGNKESSPPMAYWATAVGRLGAQSLYRTPPAGRIPLIPHRERAARCTRRADRGAGGTRGISQCPARPRRLRVRIRALS